MSMWWWVISGSKLTCYTMISGVTGIFICGALAHPRGLGMDVPRPRGSLDGPSRSPSEAEAVCRHCLHNLPPDSWSVCFTLGAKRPIQGTQSQQPLSGTATIGNCEASISASVCYNLQVWLQGKVATMMLLPSPRG